MTNLQLGHAVATYFADFSGNCVKIATLLLFGQYLAGVCALNRL